MASKENQTVINVSPRLNALDQDEENHQEQHDTNVTISPREPPTLADDLERGTSLLNKEIPAAKTRKLSDGSSSSKYEGPAAKTRKLSDGSSEARDISLLETSQFYQSHASQLMTLESDRDSKDEVDYYILNIDEHQTLFKLGDESPDGKRLMFLWNSFVRKQRVFADGGVPWACEAFSKFHKQDLIHSKPLHWCWRMFLLKLWNYKLLTAVTFNKCNLIVEDIKDDSDNTDNNNSVGRDIDLKRNNTMDGNDNSVDGGIDLNNETMDVNKNGVARGTDLISNETMDVNKSSVGRGIDLNNNVVASGSSSNSVDRGNDLNRNDVMRGNENSVDRGFDLNKEYVTDDDEDVNDNEDKE